MEPFNFLMITNFFYFSFLLMPYRRRYRRARSNPDKYSVETVMFSTPASVNSWEQIIETGQEDTRQFGFVAVNASTIQGMRKVKHITMTFSSSTQLPVAYALVYTPAGYNANNIRWPITGNQTSIYEPNQFVLSRGVLDFSGGPLRVSTPLSRNLNSGDRIDLIFAIPDGDSAPAIIATIKYAITLQ